MANSIPVFTDLSSQHRTYIWQHPEWPHWHFDNKALAAPLTDVYQAQSHVFARTEKLSENERRAATHKLLVEDVVNTSDIEGERLDAALVRATLAAQLGLDEREHSPSATMHIRGIMSMTLDAATQYLKPLTSHRLFTWHDALLPSGYSVMAIDSEEGWRDDADGPMQVVSGRMSQGKHTVHFQAPPAARINQAMGTFLRWFNAPTTCDPFIKAGLAHLWFLTIHPFGDGNGRIARAINDMALARAHGTGQRFYSFSAQLQREKGDYYAMLELTQKGELDVTRWLGWFLGCLKRACGCVD